MSAVRLAVAAAIALAACAAPAASAAITVPAPSIGKPTAAHVIATPAGKRLAIAIPVTYRTGAGVSVHVTHARVTARLELIARLASGEQVHAQTSLLQVSGASSRILEHHAFFSAGQTRKLLAAHGKKVRLHITADEAVDANGDGVDDGSSSARATGAMPALTPALDTDDVTLGHAYGSDPCGYYGLSQCMDEGGSTFTAHHFWDSNTQVVDCPATGFPYTNQDTTTLTNSSHYTETTWIFTGDTASHITITDDNVRHHPYTYQPWIACTATDPGDGNGPPAG